MDECPKHNPGKRSSFKIYPNGQNSGKNYIKCGYFSDGKINYEKHYVNRKLHGKSIIWSNLNGIHYVRTRSNYKMNKLHGIKEEYRHLKSGAVIRYSMKTYAGGKQHGDSANWHGNGRPQSDCTFFQGKPLRCNNYNKDGSFAYCTDYQRDGRPRDCKTGRLR
jgi:antitoxin component YwqK of YwqJK toxin-antitoxin module